MEKSHFQWTNFRGAGQSADEFHASTISHGKTKNAVPPIDLLKMGAHNFLIACDELQRERPAFGGGRLKVHAALGRLTFHRRDIFGWIDDLTWNTRVISSEGLIRSGRSSSRPDAVILSHGGPLSVFILPGAEFLGSPHSNSAQSYFSFQAGGDVFLDRPLHDEGGAAIVGWWNLVNRVFCGGTACDSLALIGR